MTAITYRADAYGPAHPSINVKVRAPGYAFRSVDVDTAMPDRTDAIHELAYERVQSDFWQAAEELADQYGIGPIAQAGRSGGWLEFPNMDSLSEPTAEWLAAFQAFDAWVDAEVNAAPARVAALAQQMAMDELGARAVNQPFSYERKER
jgi:hypothetical protein